MKHFYLVYYFSDSYRSLVRCDSLDEINHLVLSAPDGSHIYSVHVYEVNRELSSNELKNF